jgi:transcription antitermination factor NusG
VFLSEMADLMEQTPPSRFPDVPIEQASSLWWVAKVKPRQEKQLAFDFINSGIEYYLPIYKKVSVRPGTRKKRTFDVPLFPGYICFAQDTPKDIFVTGRVVNLIEVKDQKRFIRELSVVYNAIELGVAVEPLEEMIALDTKVEVVSGLLKGIQGVVASIKNRVMIILEVSGLGRAAVQIEMAQVRVI